MVAQETYTFIWQKTRQNSARLLRAYGQTPEVRLPEQIAGLPLEEIGSYCFAETERLPEGECCVTKRENGQESFTKSFSDGLQQDAMDTRYLSKEEHGMRILCGSYLEKVVFPDTVRTTGSLVFYNCTGLLELQIGNGLESIGSDAFMNCKNFHSLSVRCGIGARSAVRQILAQISHDMEVEFWGENGIEAKVFFPEYYESYDEIAPAHLFGRNIEGEGFRARQCFKEGRVDLPAYDGIFARACVDESERTLGQMAENRLRYPAELSAAKREQYENYIRSHAGKIAVLRAKEKDLDSLQFLCSQNLLSGGAVTEAILACTRMEWAEGAASLMQYKNEMAKEQKNRYEFDDF